MSNYLSREDNSLHIHRCTWLPTDRLLVSDIPILYTASPPYRILVIGRTKRVMFEFKEHLHNEEFTLYLSEELGIKLFVPWDRKFISIEACDF